MLLFLHTPFKLSFLSKHCHESSQLNKFFFLVFGSFLYFYDCAASVSIYTSNTTGSKTMFSIGCLHGYCWIIPIQLFSLGSAFLHWNSSPCCLSPYPSKQREQGIQGFTTGESFCRFCSLQLGAPFGYNEFPRLNNASLDVL